MRLRSTQTKQNKTGSTKQTVATTMAQLLEATGYNIPVLRRGQEFKGKVVSISPTEILIDIGAKSEGIVAGRELSAVRDIASKLAAGDEIDVSVLYPENDSGQVVLSLRKLSQDARWAELEDKKDGGEDIEVVAQEVNRGGVICDYLGIRGFLPASQLSRPPAKLADLIGRSLSCRVIEVERITNRLIFSQKSPEVKDLKAIGKLLSKIEIGQKVEGVVTAVLPFGIFVEIDVFTGPAGRHPHPTASLVLSPASPTPTLDSEKELSPGARRGFPTPVTRNKEADENKAKLEGLVHISEISWEKIDDPAKLFKVGDTLTVMVVAKEEETGRLNLSLKQLAPDPFLEVSSKYAKDQQVAGIVARVTPYGVFVTLEEGIEGLVHISKIPPNVNFEVGQKVECLVDSIDTRARHISLVPVAREKPILYR